MKNFIFDVDGTLLDTQWIFYESLSYALQAHGIQPERSLQGLFGGTLTGTLCKLNIPADHAVGVTWEKRFDEMSRNSPFYDGIEETFRQICGRNGRILIATSRNHATADPIWKDSALSPYIDFCVATEDTAKHKPHPDPLLYAMKQRNLDPEDTIYIGDTISDYMAARDAGIAFAAAKWNPEAAQLPGIALKTPQDLVEMAGF